MHIRSLIPAFAILLTCNVAMAKTPKTTARSSVFAVIPGLALNLPIKGDVGGIGVYGIGLNHKWGSNLYTGAQMSAWFNGVDDLGQTYDLNVGYAFNLNTNKAASWLIDVVPQLGYRHGRRWYYDRDGFGPENISHGILAGASYDFYHNSTVGFLVRAHTMFEWAPYSVIVPRDSIGNPDDRALTTGVDVGLSIGMSFGHK